MTDRLVPKRKLPEPSAKVVLGEISGLYGVRGWLKVQSYTQPRSNILDYDPWHLGDDGNWKEVRAIDGRSHGKGVVVQLEGCTDRDQAARLIGQQIAVERRQLPEVAVGVYYWHDLEGLLVETQDGILLGRVDYLFETGSNDVLVVTGERRRLIPFVMRDVVLDVDFDAKRMTVDWDPEF